MDSLFLANLGSPPLLFFFLGVGAALLRSDLEVPTQVAKFLSLYLLLAIGFKGGVALAQSPLDASVLGSLLAALALACAVPLYTFFLLRRRLPVADAAAIAATYGSVSAVTFVTCTSYLDL
ncbi:MAG TPA: sodium-dependent bicarbonate transport family permease, partial [Gammaproteobacteria bacterium]